MLDSHEISVSCLLIWSGIFLGIFLLAAAEFISDDLARWGLAVLCIACTYSLHRSMAAREDRLREAFEMGRAHERGTRELHALP